MFNSLMVFVVAAAMMPFVVMSPFALMVNFVTPLLLAVIRLPLFTLFNTNAALLPIPPDTERTAGVLFDPIYTPLSKSDERIVFPVPAAVRVRFPLPDVVSVALPVLPSVATTPAPPRLSAVADPPMLRLATFALKTDAALAVDVISADALPVPFICKD